MEQERIPFDIKYRSEIEAGKYLVQTRTGESARIICWDRAGYFPIVALVQNNESESTFIYSENGEYDEMVGRSVLDLFLVPNPDYKEPAAKPSADSEKDIIVSAIEWTGSNLKEVIEFTGKSPRFDEWFKSWDEFESYVHSHDDILKLFCEDGSHYEVPVGAWIVKTPDGRNVPSIAKYIQQGWSSVDWDAFRREAAKDILCAFIIHNSASSQAVDSAVEYADKLIKRLKED